MIDVALELTLADGARRFTLSLAFASDASCVALHGPSGAGKSLTLQAIAGLVRPRSGHVRIGSTALFDAATGIEVPTLSRRIGYLFQHYALFPHLNVRQNVAFGLTSWRHGLADADAAWVDDLLARLGLCALGASRPAALSGGQQQRVALARALACRPRLLLLDEPFGALNPKLRRELRAELAAAREAAGIPMVLVTHDLDDVRALAGDVVLVDEGRALRQVALTGERGAATDALQHALLDLGWT